MLVHLLYVSTFETQFERRTQNFWKGNHESIWVKTNNQLPTEKKLFFCNVFIQLHLIPVIRRCGY